VQEFTPSDDERRLAAAVGDYLRRPQLEALPSGQRQLISMVLWKLLASSSHAIAGALDTMANRLQKLAAKAAPSADLVDELDDDFEALDASAEEWNEAPELEPIPSEHDERAHAIAAELAELRQFVAHARQIRQDAKGQALLRGLERAFAELQRLGAPRKAIVFTESRRTQDYAAAQWFKQAQTKAMITQILFGVQRLTKLVEADEQFRLRCYKPIVWRPYDPNIEGDRREYTRAVNTYLELFRREG
jgi:hypothetical protein